jgi:hypothetical protein
MEEGVTTTKIKENKKNNNSEREDIKVKMFFNCVKVPSYMNCRILRTETFNLLKAKSRLLYLKTQFVPRSKHFSFRL